MTDPVALLSEYLRIDTSNPGGFLGGGGPRRAPRRGRRAVHVDGVHGLEFLRSIGIPTYGLMPVLLPRAEHGKIHGVDERIPVDGIEEMTNIIYALIEGWNA